MGPSCHGRKSVWRTGWATTLGRALANMFLTLKRTPLGEQGSLAVSQGSRLGCQPRILGGLFITHGKRAKELGVIRP